MRDWLIEGDELAASYSITSSASESTSGGIESPSALAVLRLTEKSERELLTAWAATYPPCIAALIEQLKPRNIGLNGQWASLTNGYGIGHKRADDSFGQACRIAFAFLRQTDDFLSDRCRHGGLTVSDI